MFIYIWHNINLKFYIMKKITLLITLIVFSFSHSQTVFTEDFESDSTLPDTWTNNDIAGGDEVWTLGSDGDAVGYTDGNTIYYENTGISGNYALFDSDSYGAGSAEESALESPVFDCSDLTSVTLKFDHFFTAGYGGQAYVDVYNGSSWVEVASYITPSGGDQSDSDFGTKEIDVSNEIAGVANAQVRFLWIGDYSWGWAFDNVEVFQCTESVPGPISTPYPVDNAVNVTLEQDTDYNGDNVIDEADAAVTFTWDDTTGGVVSNYTFRFGTENPPTQEFTANTNDGFSLFGLDTNTEYFWSVTANNCAGSSDETIFSFTTSSTLSNTDFEVDKVLEHFVSNRTLTVNANSNIDKIEIFNMLGQLVHTSMPKNDSAEINLSALNTGMFISKVKLNGYTETFKFYK